VRIALQGHAPFAREEFGQLGQAGEILDDLGDREGPAGAL